MSKMKLIGLAALFLLGVIPPTFAQSPSASELRRALQANAKKINMRLPQAFGNGVVWESVQVVDVNQVNIYRLPVEKSHPQVPEFKATWPANTRRSACSDPYTSKMLAFGVKFTYVYRDRKAQSLFEFDVTQAHCHTN